MKKEIIWNVLVVFLLAFSLNAQDSSSNNKIPQTVKPEIVNGTSDSTSTISDSADEIKSPQKDSPWLNVMLMVIALLSLVFGVCQYLKRKADARVIKRVEIEEEKKYKDEQDAVKHKTDEQELKDVLKKELGTIRILGSPDIDSLPVSLLDAFVPLDISETWLSEKRFDPEKPNDFEQADQNSSPERVIKRAFSRQQMLLIIGDPGSGKTTLLKYYTMCCLTKDHYKKIGFDEPVLPLYLPLRELEFVRGTPVNLPDNLAKWAKDHVLGISSDTFRDWLRNRPTLVLLDGLDEISSLELRKKACEWIDKTATGLKNTRFIVTSRWTGYRKLDGIEIGFDHLRADVKDFTLEKQEEFLRKWFCAVFKHEVQEGEMNETERKERQTQLALQKAKKIINFLQKKENKGVRELAAVPMLLQIMAIIWKEREHLPQNRQELYKAALNYLLDFRDRKRHLNPVLPADKAIRILSPTALWMQEEIRKDDVAKKKMYDYMQDKLNTFDIPPNAEDFCINLRDRAGLIADYGKLAYIFRHKSFREYLAGLQLAKESREKAHLKKLVQHFGEDWWEEPLRFFISESDAEIFDNFLDALFRSSISKELDQKTQNFLQTLIIEAPEKKTDALGRCLNDRRISETKKRYILECLNNIGKADAIRLVEEYAAHATGKKTVKNYASEISSTLASAVQKGEKTEKKVDIFKTLPPSFRNPFESNAEYLLIPGGKFHFSVADKQVQVPDVYFAKYTVTNQHYRMFINFLSGNSSKYGSILTRKKFDKTLFEYAETIEGFSSYLSKDPKKWDELFRSYFDTDKKYNLQDQPVVSITWYAAQAYCVWLTLLDMAANKNPEQVSYLNSETIYRLPLEKEWEWAAAGREPNDRLRKYPWGDKEPNKKLANYHMHVGTPTSAGRYPDGATPEGLMDLAGNVWEWCQDWYDEDKDRRVLRGGSFFSDPYFLRCTGRSWVNPDDRVNDIGFRVVRALGS